MSVPSVPRPEVALRDHCSVVYGDTLYVYQPEAFQSLPLREGAEWTTEAMGVSVAGATCTLADPGEGDSGASMFVTGGTPTSEDEQEYPGLQRYWFSNKTWETIRPVVTVTQRRLGHSSAYLNTSSSLLIYAGSQMAGDRVPSPETFLIQTSSPYGVLAYGSTNLPVDSPVLEPWNATHAVSVGGNPANPNVYVFSREQGWADLNTTLPVSLEDRDQVQATVVSGSDGSKVLQVYDMSASPNEVNRYAIVGPSGEFLDIAENIQNTPAKRRKRELSLEDWPAYNDTLAPREPRTDFTVSRTANGLAVIAGGNEDYPVALFDEQTNSWIDPELFFTGRSVVNEASTPAATSSGTVTSSAAATEAGSSGGNNTDIIVGCVLGIGLGLIVIGAVIFFLLRRRRTRKRERDTTQRHTQMLSDDDKSGMSFADRGAPFMPNAAGSKHHSTHSFDSNAILSGAIRDDEKDSRYFRSHSRDGSTTQSHHREGSTSTSTAGLMKNKSPLGLNEPLELKHIRESASKQGFYSDRSGRGSTATGESPWSEAYEKQTRDLQSPRSSGWSKYFNGSDEHLSRNSSSVMPPGYHAAGFPRPPSGATSKHPSSLHRSNPSAGSSPVPIFPPSLTGAQKSQAPVELPTTSSSAHAPAAAAAVSGSQPPMETHPALLLPIDRSPSVSTTTSEREGKIYDQETGRWTPIRESHWDLRIPDHEQNNRMSRGASSTYTFDLGNGSNTRPNETIPQVPGFFPQNGFSRPGAATTGTQPQQLEPQPLSWLNLRANDPSEERIGQRRM